MSLSVSVSERAKEGRVRGCRGVCVRVYVEGKEGRREEGCVCVCVYVCVCVRQEGKTMCLTNITT